MNDFLPKGYKEPVETNYMKFELGDNAFRVLASAVVGWEYWTEERMEDGSMKKRPYRVKEEGSIPVEKVVENKYGDLNISYFWAFPVYNVSAEKIQILEITQKSIRKDMMGYISNPKWGDPKNYTFVVTKEKNGDKTEYRTIAEPKEELDQSIVKKFKDMGIDMIVWMDGKDPFKKETEDTSDVEDIK